MSDEEYVSMTFNYEMNRDVPSAVEEWEELSADPSNFFHPFEEWGEEIAY
jgi:hypothetical protein|tara:strand:+ start:593 stop:742 length:150 start_codon:yes stop_codon:yes gene_type:complete